MAAIDHNILWYLNGKYQPDFEGYTEFNIKSGKKRKTGAITYELAEQEYTPYVKGQIALLNGDCIQISRDCCFYKLIDHTGQIFRPSDDKDMLPNHLIKEEKPIFIETLYDEATEYYEPKYAHSFWEKITTFFCPVYRKPQYKTKYLVHSTDTTFLLAVSIEDDCYASFIIDKVYGYSLVGMGGYGWYSNPYIHFINRGYGQAFETLAAYECYDSYLMETLFYDYMEDYCRKNPDKALALMAFPNKDYEFLKTEIAEEESSYWKHVIIVEALRVKFGWVRNWSAIWTHFNFVRPSATDSDQAIIHSACFADYNMGNYNPELTDEIASQCTEFIIQDEEYQEGLKRLSSVKLPPSSKFTYTLSQYQDKYMDLIDRQKREQEKKEATQNDESKEDR